MEKGRKEHEKENASGRLLAFPRSFVLKVFLKVNLLEHLQALTEL